MEYSPRGFLYLHYNMLRSHDNLSGNYSDLHSDEHGTEVKPRGGGIIDFMSSFFTIFISTDTSVGELIVNLFDFAPIQLLLSLNNHYQPIHAEKQKPGHHAVANKKHKLKRWRHPS